MNPGAIEEAGQTSRSLISSLGSQPMVLALVALQVVTMGVVLYSAMSRQASITNQFNNLHDLLSKCLAGHIGGG